jgi:uncharacterized membrane protein HdeD (DUF308 family)
MAERRDITQGNGFLLRGAVAVAFGLLVVIAPESLLRLGPPVIGLVLVFLSMMTAVIALATEPTDRERRVTFLLFILSLLAGMAVLVSTGVQDPTFFIGFAVWLFLTGIAESVVALADDLRDLQGIIMVNGILSIAFGLILLAMDIRATGPLLLTLGLFVFIHGIFSMLSGIMVRLGSGVPFD